MVGENTVEMKKLEEITLEDIQNYLRKYDCDGVITTKLVEKNNTETLQVFEFDGLYDDTIWVCSIYKNEDNDFYIKTADATSPFNHADGVEYDDKENELFKISTIVAELLSYLFALKRSNSKENWPKSVRQLIFKLRRRVETVFSQLSGQLNAERVLAKSFQGLCTRLVNKVLAYNLCIALNSIFGETCELGKIKKLIF